MSDAAPTPHPLPLGERLRRRWRRMVEKVDHGEILRLLREDGELSARYLFMVVMAAGIATIGLLLNSPAVIIGAMLISPLMGPIALAGAGVATVSPLRLRVGLGGLAAGAALALVVAGAIVAASPIQENTPEILARTRPNLFDLIVAVLSGLAGGYATVRGKGGAVVGVAIATALMPPLAVVAFGLVSHQWPLARGAGLLFLANMVAIALSIALVLTWFGFARRGTRSKLVWQTALAGALLLPLAWPLTASLLDIVDETLFVQRARTLIAGRVADQGRIESLGVDFGEPGRARVDALVLVREPIAGIDDDLTRALSEGARRQVRVVVAQLQVSDPSRPRAARSAVANPVAAPATAGREASPVEGFPLPLARYASDVARRIVTLEPAPQVDLPIAALRQIEAGWAQSHPGWTVVLRPPLRPLAPVSFEFRSAELDAAAREAIADAIWAARAWGARELEVTGYSSTQGGGTLPLAVLRAENVARVLADAGFKAAPRGIYPAEGQRELERDRGMRHFQRVDIRPRLD